MASNYPPRKKSKDLDSVDMYKKGKVIGRLRGGEVRADNSAAKSRKAKSRYARKVEQEASFSRGSAQRSKTISEAKPRGVKNPRGAAGNRVRNPETLRRSGEVAGELFDSGWKKSPRTVNLYAHHGNDQYISRRFRSADKNNRKGQNPLRKR